MPEATWSAQLRSLLDGAMATVQAAVPGMRRRGWGASCWSRRTSRRTGLADAAAYAAGKAGLHGLARTLAHELGADGVLVNLVAPA